MNTSFRCILTIIFLLTFAKSCVWAQPTFSIHGKVIDNQSGLPVEGASVVLKSTSKGSTTDEDGQFVLPGIAKGDVSITVSFIGYLTKEINLKITGDKNIQIWLSAGSTELFEVTVVGETDEQEELRKVVSNVMPVTVITAKQIENRAGNLNEILARQAGVQMRLTGGLGSESRISVRGLVASYGFGGPTRKAGFLRIKSGTTSFDPAYFFNTSDYSIEDIPGNKVDYLQRMRYAGNGIVYSTGNIYSLASNPPDYVKDRTYGSFKVDLINQTIEKLDLPYSNGMAACVLPYDGKILWGLATTTGVGIYSYDPGTNTASEDPIVNTQGDPSIVETFKN